MGHGACALPHSGNMRGAFPRLTRGGACLPCSCAAFQPASPPDRDNALVQTATSFNCGRPFGTPGFGRGRDVAAKHPRGHGGRHGLLRPGMLRRRNRHAQHRSPCRRGAAVHAVLQRRALLSLARVSAHWPVSARCGHRAHARRLRHDLSGLPRLHQRQLPDARRGASTGRVPHLFRGQVARGESAHAHGPPGELAVAAGL